MNQERLVSQEPPDVHLFPDTYQCVCVGADRPYLEEAPAPVHWSHGECTGGHAGGELSPRSPVPRCVWAEAVWLGWSAAGQTHGPALRLDHGKFLCASATASNTEVLVRWNAFSLHLSPLCCFPLSHPIPPTHFHPSKTSL